MRLDRAGRTAHAAAADWPALSHRDQGWASRVAAPPIGRRSVPLGCAICRQQCSRDHHDRDGGRRSQGFARNAQARRLDARTGRRKLCRLRNAEGGDCMRRGGKDRVAGPDPQGDHALAGCPADGFGRLNPMANAVLADIATEAVTSIEDVGSRIEDVFARVGGHLGRAHTIFEELTRDLSSASRELSGSKIEGASIALQDIAGRLSGLAEALPAETSLLDSIGRSAGQTSTLLTHLVKHIQMITVIARSSRIEAASLDGNRSDFLSFTQEASDLANSVQVSIVACSKDQEHLADALEMALSRQLEFEKRYGDQLLSVSADLISVYSEIKDRQAKSAHLAELARASTMQIGDTVGGAIVSLQAGESRRHSLGD